jgi:tRNA nucleotidyltransferase (CCA-adding enzyme)
VVHPSLVCDNHLVALLNAARRVLAWYDLLFLGESYMKWAVYFLALVHRCEPKTVQEICRRFELPPRLEKIFVGGRTKAEDCLYWLGRNLPADNSTLHHRLMGLRTELILFMMAASDQEKVKKAISLYVTNLRRISISLKGEDLMRLGVRPGPIYRQVFQAVLDAKMNGGLETNEDELAFARDMIHRS